MNFIISSNLEEMNHRITELIFAKAGEKTSRFSIALSGGNTPKILFYFWAEKCGHLDWSMFDFFWVDERLVQEEDEESNYGEFWRTIEKSNLANQANFFPIYFRGNAKKSLEDYKNILNEKFIQKGFDLAILGIGQDGHVASIFPDNLDSFSSKQNVEIVYHPLTKQRRISVSGSFLNKSQDFLVICTGENKADILCKIKNDKDKKIPAEFLSPLSHEIFYFIDENAGKKI